MNSRSKGRGRPGPDAVRLKHVLSELDKALKNEDKYMSNLFVAERDAAAEDALLGRGAAARNMRLLKMWFDLPGPVFLTALNILDRFLTKMKVKPTFLACVSISCLYVASDLHKCQVNPSQLIAISQTKCKVTDLERMSDIIRDKLGLISKDASTYLSYYIKIIEFMAKQLTVKSQCGRMLQKRKLLTRLEVVMLDTVCASMRPSQVALALIQVELERHIGVEMPEFHSHEIYQWLTIIYELQSISKINSNAYFECYKRVKRLIENYDNNVRTSAPTRLKWRFSLRRQTLRPSENFIPNLYRLQE